ncbi:sulfurtransferase complex subunit TusB [Orbaceae bacterium ESL0727]|nr:sulfurtransferase complex subunit TusB [Orbaceae bacterium ESL0727]
MLHTLSTTNTARINLPNITENDVVLFWQNSVILALQGHPFLDAMLKKTSHCYILESDMVARGLTELIDNRVKIITMLEVVQLTASHPPQINWGD